VPGLPLSARARVLPHEPDPILVQFDGAPCAWRAAAGPFALLADRALPGFAPAPVVEPSPLPPAAPSGASRRGRGWIDESERDFVLSSQAGRHRLQADAIDLAWSADGLRVWCPTPPADDPARQAALGIGLVAALAARGVFCLHASAVRWRDGCVAFAGASGAGKSTLARAIDAAGLAPRVVDDVLPLDRDAVAWPAFPQWKLPPAAWWPAAQGGLRLEALVLLARGAGAHCTALSGSAAVQALIAATAGARAFPEPVLAEHLAVVARWSRRLPVLRLTVPDRPRDPAGAARAAFDVLDAQPWS
jgi:hypothetical protein